MNRDWAGIQYTTIPLSNNESGNSGLDLYHINKGEKKHVARILFWDASGQFFFETLNTDLPLNIVEEFIAEAKTTIKTR